MPDTPDASTPGVPAARAARGAGRPRLYYGWVLVVALGITETVSWGILYYAFAVFVLPMEAELGWSRTAISGAFALAVLLSGLAAVPVGRWLDRNGARALMTAGSAAGTGLVLAWSTVRDLPVFYLIWAAIGLTMATVLYEPAFAVVTVWFRRRRASALTAVTLVAGLASTIFLPLAGWLLERQGWRQALVTLAAGRGAATLARATSVAGRYGTADYASISGVLALCVTAAQAAGPLVTGAGYDRFGAYEPVFWALAAVSTLAALAAVRSERAPAAPAP